MNLRLKRLLLRAIATVLAILLFLPIAVAQTEQVTVRLDGRAVFRVGGIGELLTRHLKRMRSERGN